MKMLAVSLGISECTKKFKRFSIMTTFTLITAQQLQGESNKVTIKNKEK